ncbi:MAG TPA: ABC transporter permease [Acidimicrobiales bacterium]|nr:ABC transporter permease [Acidimicrobiales bacterium]
MSADAWASSDVITDGWRASALRITAVARRHAYVLQRAPQRWFDVVFWPLVDTILFGALGVQLARASHGGHTAVGGLLAGILLFHVVFQAEIGLSTGFMEETWDRNLLNLLVTPLRESEYVAGVVLFGLGKLAIAITTVSVVAYALFAFHATDLGPGLIPLVAVLLVIGWSVGLVVIGLILRVGQGAEILAWGLLAIVMPLSGTFYPVSALPGLLQPVAHLLPTTRVFTAGRTVLAGGAIPWGQIAWGALGAVVIAAASVWWLRRSLAAFRARGSISRHV